MLQCAIEQMMKKEERKREEEKVEGEFKTRLLEKFVEDEKLEQYNMQRRRQKEIDYKKEVRYIFIYNKYYFRLRNNGKKNLININNKENRN
jgi:hypothetical protein